MRYPLREGRLSSPKEARKELLMECAPRGAIPVTFHLTQGHCSASQDTYDLRPPTLTSLSSPWHLPLHTRHPVFPGGDRGPRMRPPWAFALADP